MISIPSIPFISVINSDNPCWDRCCSPRRLRWMHRPRKVHDIERGNFHQVKPQTKFENGFCRLMSCTSVKSFFPGSSQVVTSHGSSFSRGPTFKHSDMSYLRQRRQKKKNDNVSRGGKKDFSPPAEVILRSDLGEEDVKTKKR